MEKCPLCDQLTYETTKNGNKICRYSKCGWKGRPLSCADMGDISKLIPYLDEEARIRFDKYNKLASEFTRDKGGN